MLSVLIMEVHFPRWFYYKSWWLIHHSLDEAHPKRATDARTPPPKTQEDRKLKMMLLPWCHCHRLCGLGSVLVLLTLVSRRGCLASTFVPSCLWWTFLALLSVSTKGMWLLSKHYPAVFCCCFPILDIHFQYQYQCPQHQLIPTYFRYTVFYGWCRSSLPLPQAPFHTRLSTEAECFF